MLISSLCKSSASWILLLSYALLDTHLCTLPVAFSNVSTQKLFFPMNRPCQASSKAVTGLSKPYQCSQLHPLRIIKPFYHVCFTLLSEGQEIFSSLPTVYMFRLCYLYLPTLCLLQYISTLPLFGACCGRDMHTHLYGPIYATGQKKRNTYSCICSQRNVLEWKEYVSTITT